MVERTREGEELWRRVGLEELRAALAEVKRSLRRFERTLEDLPPCSTCARTMLLEHIHTAGRELTGRVTGVALLAESLREAVAEAERVHATLSRETRKPCRCASGICTCHE